jgi:hypothetical protein
MKVHKTTGTNGSALGQRNVKIFPIESVEDGTRVLTHGSTLVRCLVLSFRYGFYNKYGEPYSPLPHQAPPDSYHCDREDEPGTMRATKLSTIREHLETTT